MKTIAITILQYLKLDLCGLICFPHLRNMQLGYVALYDISIHQWQ